MLKVLIVTPEASPFAQNGGLADIMRSLPHELRKNDLDVRVIMPQYRSIPASYINQTHTILETIVHVSWRQQPCSIKQLTYHGLPVYFVNNTQYFDRDSLYCYPDDAERFVFFCRAALNILPQINFIPDIIQTFDWQTGILHVIFKNEHIHDPRYAKIKTLYTIRHLDEQGIFPPEITNDVLGLDWKLFTGGQIEFSGKINLLKAGIVFTDKILVQGDAYGKYTNEPQQQPLSSILNRRMKDISLLQPGINHTVYNPKTDKHIFVHYNAKQLNRKTDNKLKLQQQMNLPQNYRLPMLAIVSRLTKEKGMDLLAHMVSDIVLKNNIQLVVLGAGDTHYEEMFKRLAKLYPTKVAVQFGFDHKMAHKIYAAADFLLTPSSYDSTTSSQWIALHYGTIPISRYTPKSSNTTKRKSLMTAVTFTQYTTADLQKAIKQAVSLYHKPNWDKTVRDAMNLNSNWQKQLTKICQLYTTLTQNAAPSDK